MNYQTKWILAKLYIYFQEKILNDLQEKIIKNKSEQNKKLEEFEQILAEKNDENDGMKDELNKQRECLENLNKLNESVSFEGLIILIK